MDKHRFFLAHEYFLSGIIRISGKCLSAGNIFGDYAHFFRVVNIIHERCERF